MILNYTLLHLAPLLWVTRSNCVEFLPSENSLSYRVAFLAHHPMHTLAVLAQLATSAALAPSALAALYSNVATDAVVTALLRR